MVIDPRFALARVIDVISGKRDAFFCATSDYCPGCGYQYTLHASRQRPHAQGMGEWYSAQLAVPNTTAPAAADMQMTARQRGIAGCISG
jgi:hypothetical protein